MILFNKENIFAVSLLFASLFGGIASIQAMQEEVSPHLPYELLDELWKDKSDSFKKRCDLFEYSKVIKSEECDEADIERAIDMIKHESENNDEKVQANRLGLLVSLVKKGKALDYAVQVVEENKDKNIQDIKGQAILFALLALLIEKRKSLASAESAEKVINFAETLVTLFNYQDIHTAAFCTQESLLHLLGVLLHEKRAFACAVKAVEGFKDIKDVGLLRNLLGVLINLAERGMATDCAARVVQVCKDKGVQDAWALHNLLRLLIILVKKGTCYVLAEAIACKMIDVDGPVLEFKVGIRSLDEKLKTCFLDLVSELVKHGRAYELSVRVVTPLYFEENITREVSDSPFQVKRLEILKQLAGNGALTQNVGWFDVATDVSNIMKASKDPSIQSLCSRLRESLETILWRKERQ